MIYLLVGFFASLVGVAVFGIFASRAYSGMGWFAGFAVSAILALILGVFVLTLAIGRPVGRRTCANWSRQTGITTKFVLLNQFDSGTCLARTPSGKWVQNTEWKAFINGK